jgi:hypothetical protein
VPTVVVTANDSGTGDADVFPTTDPSGPPHDTTSRQAARGAMKPFSTDATKIDRHGFAETQLVL